MVKRIEAEVEVEVECEGPHCDDDSCRCRQQYDRELSNALDTIWRETGPVDERLISHGWEKTMVEPWRSIATNLSSWKVWPTV